MLLFLSFFICFKFESTFLPQSEVFTVYSWGQGFIHPHPQFCCKEKFASMDFFAKWLGSEQYRFAFLGWHPSYATALWHYFACNLEFDGKVKARVRESVFVTLVWGRKEWEGQNIIFGFPKLHVKWRYNSVA